MNSTRKGFATLLTFVALIGAASAQDDRASRSIAAAASAYEQCVLRTAFHAVTQRQTAPVRQAVSRACSSLASRFIAIQIKNGVVAEDAGKNFETLRRQTSRVVGAYLIAAAAIKAQDREGLTSRSK